MSFPWARLCLERPATVSPQNSFAALPRAFAPVSRKLIMAMRSHYCGLVTEVLLGETVVLCGWVNRRRDHGGVIFVDVRDREGYVQVVCDPDRAAMFAAAESLRNEFCIQVRGVVRERPSGTANDSLRSGKIEVLCHELTVLNPSVTPPFQLDDDNLSETTRLTHRVLDLRRPYMQNNLMLRYKVTMEEIGRAHV